MNTVLLNTAAVLPTPAPLAVTAPAAATPVAAATAAVASAFASTLAVQQHASLPEALQPETPTAPVIDLAVLAAPHADAAPGAEQGSQQELPPVSGETSYALAALGLWQTVPAVAATLQPAAVLAQPQAATAAATAAAATVTATATATVVALPSGPISADPTPLEQGDRATASTAQLPLAPSIAGTAAALPEPGARTALFAKAADSQPSGKRAVDAVRPDLGGRTALPTQALAAAELLPASNTKASFEAAQPEPGARAAAIEPGLELELDTLLPGAAAQGPKAAVGSAGPAVAGTASLALKGEPTQWQQPLLQALGDRLQVQIAGRSEQAVIRLSPPLLGQVEIAIRQQAGELQVRMSATHEDVARQLRHVSDSLRHELVQRHSGEVTVQVTQSARSDDGRPAGRDAQQQAQDQRDQQQQQQRRPGRALSEEEAVAAARFPPALTAADLLA